MNETTTEERLLERPKLPGNLDPRTYLSDDYVVFDVETTNLDNGSSLNPNNRLLLGAFYHPEIGLDSAISGTNKWDGWLRRIQRAKFIVAHSSKFEYGWLDRCGIDISSILCWDTLLAQYCLLGNRKGDLSLSGSLEYHGLGSKEAVVATWISSGVDPQIIPKKRLREYCETDVEQTNRLFIKQRKQIVKLKLLPVLYTRCLTSIVLTDIEKRGMQLDRPEVEKEFRKTLAESDKCLSELNEITGGINPKSPKQVAEFLYDKLGFEELLNRDGTPIRTGAGGRKTDEATVAQLTARSPEQKRFADSIRSYSPVKKRLETLKKLYECCTNGDLLHANFNQAVTVTHRLSSSGRRYKVQFQNIDRDLKKLFKSRHEGWKIGSADGKQLEFRVAVEVSQDPQGISDIKNKIDVHMNTAVALYGKPKDKITKRERTEAKPYTFRPVFGGSGGTPEIRRYCKWFQSHYNVLYRTQEGWTNSVATSVSKSLRASSGLIFYWPDCKIDSKGNISHRTEIFNYRIQSFATADIIPIALIYCWYRMRGMESFLINTVHDSIVGEIHPDEQDKFKDIVKVSFTSDVFNYLDKVYNYKFKNVPLGVTWDLGDHWDTGVEEEYEELNEGT